MTRIHAFLALAVVAAIGCSSPTENTPAPTSDGGTDAASASDGAVDAGPQTPQGRFCAAYVARDKRCDPQSTAPGIKDCDTKSDYACLTAISRPADLEATSACIGALTCGTPDETCPQQVGASHKVYTDFSARCLARQAACSGDAGPGFKDDDCTQFTAIFNDAVITAWDSCLAKPCGEVRTCFQDAVHAANPACASVTF